MNIFFLSLNPKCAAELHCDTHVVKMILESAQLLYSAHWMLNPEGLPEHAYKLAHKHHPCSLWTRRSLSNYMWLASLAWWLCKEYQYRYGEERTHKSESHIIWLITHPPASIPFCVFTEPPQAMPDEYKDADLLTAYKRFYLESKHKTRGIVKYTRRLWPEFLMV